MKIGKMNKFIPTITSIGTYLTPNTPLRDMLITDARFLGACSIKNGIVCEEIAPDDDVFFKFEIDIGRHNFTVGIIMDERGYVAAGRADNYWQTWDNINLELTADDLEMLNKIRDECLAS